VSRAGDLVSVDAFVASAGSVKDVRVDEPVSIVFVITKLNDAPFQDRSD
jgi:hypothetical protein